MQQDTVHPTLESVQSPLLECFYLLSTSRSNEAYIKFGGLVQIIITLGYHRRKRRTGYNSDTGPVEAECRKRAFWAAYVLDRYLSVMGGRPRLFQDPDLDQGFPERVNDEDLTTNGTKPRRGPFDCIMDASIMHIK